MICGVDDDADEGDGDAPAQDQRQLRPVEEDNFVLKPATVIALFTFIIAH